MAKNPATSFDEMIKASESIHIALLSQAANVLILFQAACERRMKPLQTKYSAKGDQVLVWELARRLLRLQALLAELALRRYAS
jgi:hypothetical protein